MNDRIEIDVLKTIFDLYIDKPKYKTIAFNTLKHFVKKLKKN